MLKHQYKNIKPLLYEPGNSGHCPVILKYIRDILTEHDISYHLVENQIKSKKLVYELIKIAKKENCNILHILTFDGLFADLFKYSFARSSSNSPKIIANYYLYNNLHEFPKSWFFNYLLAKNSINKILVSDEFLEARNYPKWKKKFINYIPDPWSKADFKLHQKESACEALNFPTDRHLFLMFGEISFRKGIDLFVDALYDLHLRNMSSFMGVIAGRISNDVRASKTYEKIILLNRQSKLIIHDDFIPEEHVSMYFSAADFIVCPYPKYFKVSSGTFTRACAAGKPSIVPDSSNLALTVSKVGAGYIFRSESVDSLTSVMESLINVERSKYSDLSHDLKLFASEREVKQYGKTLLNTYLEIIA
jgi:glycosyltransferase involved in cell wall biosynthesis